MKRRIPLTLAAAIVLPGCLAAGGDRDTQTSPTPAVSKGSISGSPGDCQGWGLPESFIFAGVADEAIDSFTGMMTPGGPASLIRCPYPAGCS
jgi:hypothetical protein